MAENNGYWTKWLVGIIATVIISFFGMTINYVVANDSCSRERDEKIRSETDAKISAIIKEVGVKFDKIQEDNNEQNVLLGKIVTSLEYIKEKVK
jgi:hypothetical protein